jgi:hypothetical protein
LPSASIGACGVAQWPDREQIGRELEFGIACLRLLCGPEPTGSSLEVTWQDHDSGQYAEISLVWPSGTHTPVGLSRYLEQCEEALDRVDECIDWQGLLDTTRPPQSNVSREVEEKPARWWDRLGCWVLGHRVAPDREPGYLDRAHPCARCRRWLHWRFNHDLTAGSSPYVLVPWEGQGARKTQGALRPSPSLRPKRRRD